MKRSTLLVLVSAALVAAIAIVWVVSKKSSDPVPAGGTSKPPAAQEPPKQETPAAPQPALVEGAVYLLAKPEKPLWTGPATVVVENSKQARPQVGLNEADMVIEALAESEVSRFLAFYWTRPVEKIGPVRSARSYMVTIADAYNAPFAHAGGNEDALEMLKKAGKPHNLDEIYGSGGFFWRTTDRPAPHNLYTSTKMLGEAVTTRKIPLSEMLVSPRAPAAEVPDLFGKAEVNWHRLNRVNWAWDGKRYTRTMDGSTAHTLESGEPVAAANLVFLQVQGKNNGPDLGWDLFLDKGGKATILAGGQRWTGMWAFGPGGFRIIADGKVPPLVPGGVWVHLITQESAFQISK